MVDPSRSDLAGHLPPPSPERRWRLIDRLVVVLFCLATVVPAALLAAGVRPALIENRALVAAPRLALRSLLDTTWYASLDHFLADNIAVRPLAAEIRGGANWLLGGTGNRDVVRGIDPWLFGIAEIQPRCDLTTPEVADVLDRTHQELVGAGQDLRFIVPPDKHVIYPDKLAPDLPYAAPCTDERRAAMRLAFADRASWAIDGGTILAAERAARPDGPALYYAQDSHWTRAGAIPAIRALIQSLGPDLWRDDDVVPGQARSEPQDLAFLMGLPRTETVPWFEVRPAVAVSQSLIGVPRSVKIGRPIRDDRATGDRPMVAGRSVIVYDSFFELNMDAVAPFFAESIWIHESDLLNNPGLANLIGPVDRVIVESVERDNYHLHYDELVRPFVRSGP